MKEQDIKKIEVTFEFEDVEHLVCTIDHVVSTCQTALLTHSDNRMPQCNDREVSEVLGSTILDISNTLGIAKQFIAPLYEPENLRPSPH